jgi:hypothetical protein
MLEQIERYADDRVLVLKRERDVAVNKLKAAEERRDQALGAQKRERAEKEMVGIEEQINNLDELISQLQDREDDNYKRCHERAHEKRFARPHVKRLLDLEFEIA